LSEALVGLIANTSSGVVAVKAAPYRVVSGLAIGNELVAVADHSLRRDGRVPILTAGGQQAEATILGRDPGVDLALLKVEGVQLSSLPAADVVTLKPGSLAAVVGMTIDVGPSASLGILGAVGGARRTWRGGMLEQFYRLDVNLYPSQSGAAVVDAEGHLIGLATAGLLRHAAVAVPVATLKRIAQELLKEGRIRRGYLGIGVQTVVIPATLREKLETAAESGLILLSVEPDSPADKAGLQLGDILIAIDGNPLSDVDELQALLRGNTVGQSLPVVLLRGGDRLEAQVVVSEKVKKGS
jgi:S1-C subfamily serine protease